MKRCPRCNRTYSTETQKFCTHDGAHLVTSESHQGETIRIDPSKIEQLDNAPTQTISRDLTSPSTGPFDPYKTVIGRTEEKSQTPSAGAEAPDPFKTVVGWQEGSRGTGRRDTQELVPPAQTSTSLPTSAPLPTPSAPLPEPTPPVPDVIAPPSAAEPQSPVSAPLPSVPQSEPQTPSSTSAPLPPGPATMPWMPLSEPPTPPSTSAPLPPGPATMPSVPLAESATAPESLSSAPSIPSSATIPVMSLPMASAVPPAPLLAPQPAISGSAAAIQPPAKRSKLPLIRGVLGLLLVLGVAGVVAVLLIKPMFEKRPVIVKHEPTPQPTMRPSPNQETTPTDIGTNINVPEPPPPYSPPADAVAFVNSKKNLDGKLAEHYVDFSFYYPNSWKKDSTAGVPGASNFAKVERRLPPDFTQENFAVGWYSSAGSPEADATVFHNLVENLNSQFKKSFPEYKKVSEGETTVGVYKGYEFRFESVSRNTVNGDVNVWGRVVLLPPPNGGKNGVTLLMLTTSLAPELKSIDDVGEKGDLPMLLQSFRFGKP